MSIEVNVGAPVPLQLQLECVPDDPVYVRATVTDHNKDEITGSPFTLSDEGNGFFCDYSLAMPNLNFITARYEVFCDDQFTEPSQDYGLAVDVFTKTSSNIQAGSSGGVELVGKVLDSVLQGKLTNPDILKGVVSASIIKGRTQDHGALKGKIVNQIIQGKVICKK